MFYKYFVLLLSFSSSSETNPWCALYFIRPSREQPPGDISRFWGAVIGDGGGGGGRGGRYSILIIAGPDEQVTITKVLTASLSFIFTRWAVVFWVADALNVNAATTYWTRPLVWKARIMTCKRKTNLISVNRLIIKELLVCPLICFLLLLWSNFLHLKKTIVVKSVHVLLFPCVSSHWWVHFPRSVLFWLSKSQDYRTVIMQHTQIWQELDRNKDTPY